MGGTAPGGPRDALIWESRNGDPVGRSCYHARAGQTGAANLAKVEAIVGGFWSGVER